MKRRYFLELDANGEVISAVPDDGRARLVMNKGVRHETVVAVETLPPQMIDTTEPSEEETIKVCRAYGSDMNKAIGLLSGNAGRIEQANGVSPIKMRGWQIQTVKRILALWGIST